MSSVSCVDLSSLAAAAAAGENIALTHVERNLCLHQGTGFLVNQPVVDVTGIHWEVCFALDHRVCLHYSTWVGMGLGHYSELESLCPKPVQLGSSGWYTLVVVLDPTLSQSRQV